MLANYMAEGEQNRAKEPLSNGFSRDLVFNKSTNGNNLFTKFEVDDNGEEEEEEGVELSLGLSLNGRFGVDPKKAKMKLMRSSSVSTTFMLGGGEESHAPVVPVAAAYAPLTRTSSLPVGTEEEWRKRKEMQCLRRMEAKRRRMDKIKSWRGGREKVVDSEENSGEENGSNDGQGSDSIDGNGNRKGYVNMMPLSQGSIGSQGSGSSGLYEFESQHIQVNKNNDQRSPSSAQSLQLHHEQKPQVNLGSVVDKAADKGAKDAKEMLENVMLNMPCVSTTGNGPNGKRIEGFLYRYRKGEEVRIMCVCHGSFLSPAEFVKHAGGTEVQHPLRHIVVNPSPLL
ncbi:hypothetical protein ACH5RR_014219 [Cinchona calisaya]|uniref:Ninja-family protein n=1 Tax=Cinchona calisaya TaxID=153742 RepID=A0ABD3A4W5_9GENT